MEDIALYLLTGVIILLSIADLYRLKKADFSLTALKGTGAKLSLLLPSILVAVLAAFSYNSTGQILYAALGISHALAFLIAYTYMMATHREFFKALLILLLFGLWYHPFLFGFFQKEIQHNINLSLAEKTKESAQYAANLAELEEKLKQKLDSTILMNRIRENYGGTQFNPALIGVSDYGGKVKRLENTVQRLSRKTRQLRTELKQVQQLAQIKQVEIDSLDEHKNSLSFRQEVFKSIQSQSNNYLLPYAAIVLVITLLPIVLFKGGRS